jgi:uncharacterized membrane protein
MAPLTSAFTGCAGPARACRRAAAALGLAALLAIPAVSAQATELGAPDARAVRATVEAQLAAFAAGDADRAFSYASDDGWRIAGCVVRPASGQSFT